MEFQEITGHLGVYAFSLDVPGVPGAVHFHRWGLTKDSPEKKQESITGSSVTDTVAAMVLFETCRRFHDQSFPTKDLSWLGVDSTRLESNLAIYGNGDLETQVVFSALHRLCEDGYITLADQFGMKIYAPTTKLVLKIQGLRIRTPDAPSHRG